jgi:DNA-binding FadR family transcriptional regulator
MSRLHRALVREMTTLIVGGDYAPGERLEREADLVQRFGVGRGVVREVMRGLEDRGLIEVRHGVGAFVAHRDEWRTLDHEVLRASVRSDDAGRRIAELVELQRLLEGRAVELAAGQLDATSARAIRDALAALHEAKRGPLISVLRPALATTHRAIVTASGLPPLAAEASEVAAVLSSLDGPESVPSLTRATQAVLLARPRAARRLIDEHLVELKARLVPPAAQDT